MEDKKPKEWDRLFVLYKGNKEVLLYLENSWHFYQGSRRGYHYKVREEDWKDIQIVEPMLNNELPVQGGDASKVESSTIRPDNNSEKTKNVEPKVQVSNKDWKEKVKVKEDEGMEHVDIWVEPVVLENNEIGYAAHFQIDNQTFFVNPQQTEEKAKKYAKNLRAACNKIIPAKIEQKRLELWLYIRSLFDLFPKSGGRCRDCAEADILGICDFNNEPCNPQERVIFKIKELQSENERLRNLLAEAEQK